jgi:hypothetical protein
MRSKALCHKTRVVHAFTRVTALQFAQVQTCAKMFATAAQHGGFGVGRQVIEGMAKRQDRVRHSSALRLAARVMRTTATSSSISKCRSGFMRVVSGRYS